ncbi:hypothetical protein ACQPW3_04265 [Actinosynnema sp. CA-248983]
MPEPNRPFRWDLVRPDHLGTLLPADPPDLWYVDDLVECAGQVLARCADSDLYFVGRSADSVFDLLSGVLEHTTWRDRLHQVPLSVFGAARVSGDDLPQLRANLTASGVSPHALATGRPTAFVDLVHEGSTYTNLYHLLRDWIEDERAAWDVVRRRLRFIGITRRRKTSPKTWRWHQHAPWAADLPASAIRNVSLDWGVWGWFGDQQPKLTRSFKSTLWSDESVAQPRHDERTRAALAEALAVVEAGRQRRAQLVAVLCEEPAIREPWLRTLVNEIRA